MFGPFGWIAKLLLVSLALAGSGLSAMAQSPGGETRERATIRSENTDVEELARLAEQVGRVPGSLLNAVVAQNKETARAAVSDFLTHGNALPKMMAARAVALIEQLRGDPRIGTRVRLLEISSMISGVVAESLTAPRILEIFVEPDYLPPSNVVALDLGAWDGLSAVGFESVTPASDRVTGRQERVFRADGAGTLLGDGIAGVERLQLALPNGSYRVILLAARPEGERLPNAPFGRVIIANSTRFQMGEALPGTWIPGGFLSRPTLDPENLRATIGQERLERQLTEEPLSGPAGMGFGIAFKVEVVHGFLEVEFRQGSQDTGALLGAIVVEPTGQPSSLVKGREIVRSRLSRAFATTLSSRYRKDPDMAAALTALAIDRTPNLATDITRAAIRANPAAAARIVEVVSHLPAVDAARIEKALEADSTISPETRRQALAALPGDRNQDQDKD